MTDITSSSTPEGAKQESTDAQIFDELTSLQQPGAAGLSAEKTDVTVSAGETAQNDDPSLVTQTIVHYGSTPLPEGSIPSPTTLGPTGANLPVSEQITALNQNLQGVATEQLPTPAPLELGVVTVELEGVPATPSRIDQTPPFVPSGFSDPSEVVVTQEDQSVIGNLLVGTTSPDGVITVTSFAVNGATYAPGQLANIDNIGSISITTAGSYTFTPLPNWNGVIPEVTYSMTDGFSTDTSTLNITVNPLNDPATITSESQNLTETNVVLSTNGQILVSDLDVGEAQAIPQTAIMGIYGEFNLSTDGSWTYVTHTPYDELPAGQQISESFTVSSLDGTAIGNVTITITGTNDLATVSSQSMSLIETNTVLSTSGVLSISDLDTGEAHVVAQTNLPGLYGHFNIEEGGAWTYVTDSAFNELPAGAQIAESFTVTSYDGTGFGVVDIVITGTNDVATVSSASVSLDETDAVLSTSGTLTIGDLDAGEQHVVAQTVSGVNGSFSIDANGLWTYEANSAYNELNAGDRISETFAVTSLDGTGHGEVTVTIIGTNDVATVSSASVSLDETDVPITTGGTLSITDLDANEAHVQVQSSTPGDYGSFSIAEDGTWSYVANSAFNELGVGEQIVDTFNVYSHDGTGQGVVTVTIVGTADLPVIGSLAVVASEISHDESSGIQVTSGADDSLNTLFSVFSVINETPLGMAEITSAAILTGSADYSPGTGGTTQITAYHLSDVNQNGFNGQSTNLEVTNGGQILLYSEGDLIVGREVGTNNIAFALAINNSGVVQLVQYMAVDHGDGSGQEDATLGSNELKNLLINGSSPIYVTETVVATSNLGESSTFHIVSDNPLQVGFLDDGPSVDFYNTVAPVNADNVYTGIWVSQTGTDSVTSLESLVNSIAINSVAVNGIPVTFSSLSAPVVSAGGTTLTYSGTFDFDSNPDPVLISLKTVNYTLTLHEEAPGQFQYTLDLDKAVQNVTITNNEFSGAVHAGGPVPTYDLTYTDSVSGEILNAVVSVQSGVSATQQIIGGNGFVTAAYTGSSLNASANGIGVDNPNFESYLSKGVYKVEGINFNPEGEASQVVIGFKGSGGSGWNNTDVLHIIVHGVDENGALVDHSFVLTGMGTTGAPIPGTIHLDAGALSYAINVPSNMSYIASVDVTTGFSQDSRGNISTTVARVTFGFATSTVENISDIPIHFEFTGAVADADGDLAYDNFTIQTMTGPVMTDLDGDHILTGTTGAENIVGTTTVDQIQGNAGNDFISGSGGSDTISGGDGTDTIYGDADVTSTTVYVGDDVIHGDVGDDVIHGDAGNDQLYGDAGADVIHGDSGNDTISGGTENDALYGDSGNDVISGDAGNDTLRGGEGNDQLFGGLGDDTLRGDAGTDTLTGGGGNDNFILSEDGSVDIVTDFQLGDKLDINDILPNSSTINSAQFQDYVQLVDNGNGGALLWVDADGSGSESSWEQVVQLDHIDLNTVNLYFDPTAQTIDFSQNAGDWDITEAVISPDDPSVSASSNR